MILLYFAQFLEKNSVAKIYCVLVTTLVRCEPVNVTDDVLTQVGLELRKELLVHDRNTRFFSRWIRVFVRVVY